MHAPASDTIFIRPPREEEFVRVHRFVSRCDGMEHYPVHLFRIIMRYLGNTCFVAEHAGEIVGFVSGMRSQRDPATLFLWEIGVDAGMRNRAVGSRLISALEERARTVGCTRIELTVEPTNEASKRLFEKAGYANISTEQAATIEVNGNVAIRDYYRPGGHYMLYGKHL